MTSCLQHKGVRCAARNVWRESSPPPGRLRMWSLTSGAVTRPFGDRGPSPTPMIRRRVFGVTLGIVADSPVTVDFNLDDVGGPRRADLRWGSSTN